jgi:hypothetical protein
MSYDRASPRQKPQLRLVSALEGDPFSPILTVEGQGNADSVVTAITTFYPPDAELTISDPRTAVAFCL